MYTVYWIYPALSHMHTQVAKNIAVNGAVPSYSLPSLIWVLCVTHHRVINGGFTLEGHWEWMALWADIGTQVRLAKMLLMKRLFRTMFMTQYYKAYWQDEDSRNKNYVYYCRVAHKDFFTFANLAKDF